MIAAAVRGFEGSHHFDFSYEQGLGEGGFTLLNSFAPSGHGSATFPYEKSLGVGCSRVGSRCFRPNAFEVIIQSFLRFMDSHAEEGMRDEMVGPWRVA